MTQLHCCIIFTVSNQSTTNIPKLTNLPKFIIKFQKQSFSKISFAFAQNNDSRAEHWYYPCRTGSDRLFSFFNSK